ncbi:hypothetical protein [Nodosilinea sp. E11]|uniref:hypothetical protein n=1 Tax=Nodosilinea sp. E11 TaxID=3037479 RepID=UPI0029342511|nr:hypothetical protein [Nodosilinea sp. E11]WOD39046.1 hypothetical protein RRF56_22835 [Nodosilinea sp. E11]
MTLATYWLTFLLSGLSLGATDLGLKAEPPGVHYAYASLAVSVPQCLALAEQALMSQGLTLEKADPSSIGGRSDSVTAVLICMEQPQDTTVIIIAASEDDEQAQALRNALMQGF